MNVNDDSERLLRAAMDRILAGTPIRSNGSYTITALATEAGLSRRTVSRAAGVLRDFRDAINGRTKQPVPSSNESESLRAALTAARATLSNRNAEIHRLRSDLTTLACRVAILSEENVQLLASAGGTVVWLPTVAQPGT